MYMLVLSPSTKMLDLSGYWDCLSGGCFSIINIRSAAII